MQNPVVRHMYYGPVQVFSFIDLPGVKPKVTEAKAWGNLHSWILSERHDTCIFNHRLLSLLHGEFFEIITPSLYQSTYLIIFVEIGHRLNVQPTTSF